MRSLASCQFLQRSWESPVCDRRRLNGQDIHAYLTWLALYRLLVPSPLVWDGDVGKDY